MTTLYKADSASNYSFQGHLSFLKETQFYYFVKHKEISYSSVDKLTPFSSLVNNDVNTQLITQLTTLLLLDCSPCAL